MLLMLLVAIGSNVLSKMIKLNDALKKILFSVLLLLSTYVIHLSVPFATLNSTNLNQDVTAHKPTPGSSNAYGIKFMGCGGRPVGKVLAVQMEGSEIDPQNLERLNVVGHVCNPRAGRQR